MTDPITNNPQVYRVLFENERVRVLKYVVELKKPHGSGDGRPARLWPSD